MTFIRGLRYIFLFTSHFYSIFHENCFCEHSNYYAAQHFSLFYLFDGFLFVCLSVITPTKMIVTFGQNLQAPART